MQDESSCNLVSIFRSRRIVLLLCLASICIGFSVVSYLYGYYCRVCSFSQWKTVIDIMNQPQYNPLCRNVSSSTYRCLPTVFYIGVSKAGTTSLVRQLATHPKLHFLDQYIDEGHNQETHRFDRRIYPYMPNFIELSEEYALSPIISDPSDVIIHYTPHYLYAPAVPFDLKSFHPDPDNIKFIVSLRNPLTRAESSYWFRESTVFNQHDKGSAKDMISIFHSEMRQREQYDICRQSLGGFNLTNAMDEYHALVACFGTTTFRSKTLMRRHIDKSIYFDQFQRWFVNFRPDQFFITSMEEYARNESQVLLDVCEFLGVEGIGVNGWSLEGLEKALKIRMNSTSNKRKTSLADADRAELEGWLEKYNRKLIRQLNGRDMGY